MVISFFVLKFVRSLQATKMQGIKNISKNTERDPERAAIVKKVVRITGVSPRHVYRVIRGDRKNENVLSCYMEILEAGNEMENRLKEEVKKLVPFN